VPDIYRVRSASITETGKVREINEDAVLESGNLYVVADGMGGHKAGEIASSLALSVISQYVEDSIGLLSGDKLMKKAVQNANAVIYGKSKSDERFRSMGTTLTALYREGDTAFIAHVGDSRAYLFREGKLRRLTTDHSLIQKLIEEGAITEEEAKIHPQRNIILRALGLEPRVEVEIASVEIKPGDKFILTTDGLTGLVEDEEIEKIVQNEREPDKAVRSLADEALARGGTDNISVVMVEFAASPDQPFLEETHEITTEPATDEAFPAAVEAGAKPMRKKRVSFTIIFLSSITLLIIILGAGAWLLWKNCHFVGISENRAVIFQGFPFWGLARKVSDWNIKLELLPIEDERKLASGGPIELSYEGALENFRYYRRKANRAVIVPNVVGLKKEMAERIIERMGLKTRIEGPPPPSDLKNRIVKSQTPKAGTALGKGRTVEILLDEVLPKKVIFYDLSHPVKRIGGAER